MIYIDTVISEYEKIYSLIIYPNVSPTIPGEPHHQGPKNCSGWRLRLMCSVTTSKMLLPSESRYPKRA